MPRISGQGSTAFDQYPAISQWGTLQPQRTTGGSLAASLPVIDAANWMNAGAAGHAFEAAGYALEGVRQETKRRVVQAYYALVAAEAMKHSYGRAWETAKHDLEIAQEKKKAGAATALDLARSRVEVAAAAQGIVDAEQGAALAVQTLRSLTSLTPSAGVPDPVVEVREEAPLEHWEAIASERSPAIKEATARKLAAEAAAGAADCALLPVLGVSITENGSSVADDQGHNEWYQAAATLTLNFGVDSVSEARAKNRGAEKAALQEALARQSVTDAVNEAWQGVVSGIALSQVTQTRLVAAQLASDLAEKSFKAGAGSHQDMVQAQRDLTQAECEKIKANTELLYSRAALRLAAALPLDE
jgi:outer membrane protein TolC